MSGKYWERYFSEIYGADNLDFVTPYGYNPNFEVPGHKWINIDVAQDGLQTMGPGTKFGRIGNDNGKFVAPIGTKL